MNFRRKVPGLARAPMARFAFGVLILAKYDPEGRWFEVDDNQVWYGPADGEGWVTDREARELKALGWHRNNGQWSFSLKN